MELEQLSGLGLVGTVGPGEAQLLLEAPSLAGLGFHLVSGIHGPQGPSHCKGTLWPLDSPSLT